MNCGSMFAENIHSSTSTLWQDTSSQDGNHEPSYNFFSYIFNIFVKGQKKELE